MSIEKSNLLERYSEYRLAMDRELEAQCYQNGRNQKVVFWEDLRQDNKLSGYQPETVGRLRTGLIEQIKRDPAFPWKISYEVKDSSGEIFELKDRCIVTFEDRQPRWESISYLEGLRLREGQALTLEQLEKVQAVSFYPSVIELKPANESLTEMRRDHLNSLPGWKYDLYRFGQYCGFPAEKLRMSLSGIHKEYDIAAWEDGMESINGLLEGRVKEIKEDLQEHGYPVDQDVLAKMERLSALTYGMGAGVDDILSQYADLNALFYPVSEQAHLLEPFVRVRENRAVENLWREELGKELGEQFTSWERHYQDLSVYGLTKKLQLNQMETTYRLTVGDKVAFFEMADMPRGIQNPKAKAVAGTLTDIVRNEKYSWDVMFKIKGADGQEHWVTDEKVMMAREMESLGLRDGDYLSAKEYKRINDISYTPAQMEQGKILMKFYEDHSVTIPPTPKGELSEHHIIRLSNVWTRDLFHYGSLAGIERSALEKAIKSAAGDNKYALWEDGRSRIDTLIGKQRDEMIKDLRRHGFRPEKALLDNMQKLNGFEGKRVSVKEIKKLCSDLVYPDCCIGEDEIRVLSELVKDFQRQELLKGQILPER